MWCADWFRFAICHAVLSHPTIFAWLTDASMGEDAAGANGTEFGASPAVGGPIPTRRSAYFKTAALASSSAVEMLQIQNMQLRQRVAVASAKHDTVLACGDAVSTPYGDGIVLAQRDSDGATAVKLHWGAIAYMNPASGPLTVFAAEVSDSCPMYLACLLACLRCAAVIPRA